MKTLFIGGDHDGEWIDIAEGCKAIRMPRKVEFVACCSAPVTEAQLEHHLYERQMLADMLTRHYVFVCVGSKGGVIQQLLAGYRTAKSAEPTGGAA